MGAPLALTRFNVSRAEIGVLRVVASAVVTIYDTMADGTAAVDAAGNVQVGAVKSTIYTDRSGIVAKTNPITADTQGLIEFYSGTKSVIHIQVVATDGTKYGIPWFHIENKFKVEMSDYPTLQAAVDALDNVNGGELHIGAGTYTFSAGALISSKLIVIRGDGIASTYVKMTAKDVDLITILNSDQVEITGIRFEGANLSGVGRGVVFKSSGYSNIHDCWFDKFPSWSIDFSDSIGDCVANRFQRIRSTGNVTGGGIRLGIGTTRAFHPIFNSCIFTTDVAISPVDVSWGWKAIFRDCTFESLADVELIYSNGYTVGLTVEDFWLETPAATGTKYLILAKAGTNLAWCINRGHIVRTHASITAAKIFKSEGATINLEFGNFLCQLGGIPAGSDDLVFTAGDIVILRGGRIIKIGNTDPKEPGITAGDWATIYREFSGSRLKLPSMTTATKTALIDIRDGDTVLDVTLNRVQTYVFGGWRDLNTAP